ncbi:HU family DNA-binding protein [Vagococcus fluvialis]|uniref:HU family DNA-binding protein n=1 Tax=Vagococcus fluvialis TaxID=2738 RepID=UPI001D09BA2C|nr:HU family DNA-binding protein [Vagococcus fluvialis]UDM72752.1 HU family DNA-binding protein [Vagococcus fluvialis]UDM78308.1 HU family DNA-binding protein [Vagococcus fluvialis]UDM84027.1 HU family DNA-binding protein [Vagococcus fluvialis]
MAKERATVTHDKKKQIELVAAELGGTKVEAEKALNAVSKVFAEISKTPDTRFKIDGIGTIVSEIKPAHNRLNNLTGETIQVAAKLKRKAIFSK